MEIKNLKMMSDNINIDEYLCFYETVLKNMTNCDWLGTFSKEELKDILNNGGKIFLFYNNNEIICSFMYMPISKKTLNKHSITLNENLVGSCGPIMVNPKYIGNNLQLQMLEILEKYCLSIGKKYIFTKFSTDNIYSKNNFIKAGYYYIETYLSSSNKSKDIYLKEL